MNKWIRLLVFLPIPLVIVLTNYIIDPANVFHDDSMRIAAAIVEGKRVVIRSGNLNERGVKHHLIEQMPETVDCIAIGPSLVMGVRTSDVGTDSFYNLGESGADYYDILAQFGLMEALGKRFERVVFCMDSYFFDETLYQSFTRHDALKPWAIYMLDYLDHQTPSVPKEVFYEKWRMANDLFSVTYFQSTLQAMRKKGVDFYLDDRWGIADESCTEAYYMPDGSWVYALKVQNKDEKDVVRHANEYDVTWQFSQGKHISDHAKDTFEKLVQYLLSKNIEVDLFLCPVAPSLYDRINTIDYYVLRELEDFAHHMAEKYNLKLTGSYNPYQLNMTDNDFYDSRHVRHELLSKYFDFRQKRR